jgi:hypothetical protein
VDGIKRSPHLPSVERVFAGRDERQIEGEETSDQTVHKITVISWHDGTMTWQHDDSMVEGATHVT